MTSHRMLLAAGASLLVCSCAQTAITSAPGCKPYAFERLACDKRGESPMVKVNLNDLTVDVPYVCADRKAVITFLLDPEPENGGSVAIVPEKAVDTWLVGTNSDAAKMIKVKVPDWARSGGEHKYSIITADGRCLDPRVRVR